MIVATGVLPFRATGKSMTSWREKSAGTSESNRSNRCRKKHSMARTPKKTKKVKTLTHGEASRKNIPTAGCQAVMEEDDRSPVRIA